MIWGSKRSKRSHNKLSFIRRIFYHHRIAANQGLAQLQHQSLLNSMVILAIGIAMALPTMLYLSFHTLQNYQTHWHGGAQAAIYLKSAQDRSAIEALVATITKDPSIQDAHYISPEEGLVEFKQATSLGKSISLLDDNPLPGVILLQPQLGQSQEAFNGLLASLHHHPLVDEIDLDINWLNRLVSLLNLGNHTVILLATLLGSSMLLIICNMVYLVLQRYSHDIEIYLSLGASKRFVRRPFLYMGIYYGALSIIASWLIILACGFWLKPSLSQFMGTYGEPLALGLPDQLLVLTSIILGLGLGFFGARLASWQFLKQHS